MLSNFVCEIFSSPGTGTVNLGGASTGRVTFASQFSSGATVCYFMEDGTNAEAGVGTFTNSSPDTLARTTVLWNSSGTQPAALNFAGSGRIYNEVPASRLAYVGANSGLSVDATAVSLPGWGGTATGSAAAVRTTPSPALGALVTGTRVSFRAAADAAAGCTLQVNSLTATAVKVYREGSIRAVRAAEWRSGQVVSCVYDGTAAAWLLDNAMEDAIGWRVVGQTTLSAGASSIDFALPSDLNYFMLQWDEATPVSNAQLCLRFSWDSGSTYRSTADDYDWFYRASTNAADTAAQNASTATFVQLGPVQSSAHAALGHVFFGRTSKRIVGEQILYDAALDINHVRIASKGNVAGAITNVRLLYSGVNIATGTKVRLLGGLS